MRLHARCLTGSSISRRPPSRPRAAPFIQHLQPSYDLHRPLLASVNKYRLHVASVGLTFIQVVLQYCTSQLRSCSSAVSVSLHNRPRLYFLNFCGLCRAHSALGLPLQTCCSLYRPGAASIDLVQLLQAWRGLYRPGAASTDLCSIFRPVAAATDIVLPLHTFCSIYKPVAASTDPVEASTNLLRPLQTCCSLYRPGAASTGLVQPLQAWCCLYRPGAATTYLL